jgi:hypothetical protein
MAADIERLQETLWKEHYNLKNYEGSWSTIQLRSLNGSVENNISIHHSALQEEQQYQDTVLLQACPNIQQVIDFFEMEKLSIRLMKLNAGAVIKPHADHDLSFEDGEVRIHIPVITNPELEFFLEEDKLSMPAGTCWYLNLSLTHRVNNFGTNDRIHLVIDGKVNEWVKYLFNRNDHAEIVMETDKKEPVYSTEDTLKIIEQLRLMNTAVARKIADEMEAGTDQKTKLAG